MIVVNIPVYRDSERIYCDFAVNISGMLLELKSIMMADSIYRWEFHNHEVESYVINGLQKKFKGFSSDMIYHIESTKIIDFKIHFFFIVDKEISTYVNEYIEWVNWVDIN